MLAEFRKFLRFGLVGAVTATVYFSILFLSLELFRATYTVGVTMAYITSVIFQFLANKYFTFGSKTSLAALQVSKYFMLLAVNYAITILIVRCVVERLGLSPYCGVLASIPLIMVVGYILSRYWVFKEKVF